MLPAPAPNSHTAIIMLLLSLLFMTPAAVPADIDPMLRYRNHGETQGLYEIRDAARQFLARQVVKHKLSYHAMDPDQRIWVPRCAVPLTARWARKTIYNDGPGIDVLCNKSVDRKHTPTWDVFVPLFETQPLS